MRRTAKLLCAVLCALTGGVVCACGGAEDNNTHRHTFAGDWTQTVTEHYKKATCEHVDERAEVGAHAYGESGGCSVCGYVPGHIHEYAAEWTTTRTGHYKAATCEHTELIGESGTHVWGEGEKADECVTCGFKRSKPDETEVWISDISLELDREYLTVGETAKSEATVRVQSDSSDPDYEIAEKWFDVEYESSDTDIASVSQSGEITAKKTGSVTISVRAKENPRKKAQKNVYIVKGFVFEAESELTRLVGYSDTDVENGYVKTALPQQVQQDKYIAKYNAPQIIYGILSDIECTVPEISITYASPYASGDEQRQAELGELGTLYINGEKVDVQNVKLKAGEYGNREVLTTVAVCGDFNLKRGTNRIIWEPNNTTGIDFEYLGALDNINVKSTGTITAYKVMWWTDRNVYYDVTGGEPINICVDALYADSASDAEIDLVQSTGMNWNYPQGMWGYRANQGAARNIIKIGGSDFESGKYADITRYGAHSDGRGVFGGYDGDRFYMLYYLTDKYEAVYDFAGITCHKKPDPQKYGGYSDIKTVMLEAESDATRLVGYDTSAVSDGYVTTAAPVRVEQNKYNAKYDNTQVIFGFISDKAASAEVNVVYEYAGDKKLSELFDIYINGEIVVSDGDDITADISYGTNRIVLEPKSAGIKLDRVTLETSKSVEISAYKVMWWTDRNVYYDINGGEKINVFVDGDYENTESDAEIDVVPLSGMNWNYPSGYWGYRANQGAARNYAKINGSELKKGEYRNILDYHAHSDGGGLFGGSSGEEFCLIYYLRDSYEAVYEYVRITCKRTSDVSQYGNYVD